jgi:hypothetical protein
MPGILADMVRMPFNVLRKALGFLCGIGENMFNKIPGNTYFLDTFWEFNFPNITYDRKIKRLYVFLGFFAFTIGKT